MKICLVTTFPPSRGGLSEYGFHIASELQRNPFLSLTVLADSLDGKDPIPTDSRWTVAGPSTIPIVQPDFSAPFTGINLMLCGSTSCSQPSVTTLSWLFAG